MAFGRSYTGVGTTKGGGDPVEQDFVNSEDELGERRLGGHAEPEARSYGRRSRRLRQNRRKLEESECLHALCVARPLQKRTSWLFTTKRNIQYAIPRLPRCSHSDVNPVSRFLGAHNN